MKKIFLLTALILMNSCSKDPVTHTLFTSSNPINGGSVSPSKTEFSNGESAEITASASSEYVFKNWTGASGIDSKTSVLMDMDKLVTANFIKKKYTLNTQIEGEGSIKETLIKLGAITNYNSGTIIELEAIPSDGWKFVKWKGDISGNKNPYIITLNSNKLVKSIFKKEDAGGGGEISNSPIDFEIGGHGSDWTWTVFENDSNPPLKIVSNPNSSGLNTSLKVAKITALKTGAPYVGCESKHGSDLGTFKFNSSNSIVKIMVYKSVISDVGLKFAESNGEAQPEIKVSNTKINEWEELTFDFSGSIGKGITGIIDQIIIFPDFNARTTDNVIYFDNITFGRN